MKSCTNLKVGRFDIRWRSFGKHQNTSIFPIVCVNGAYQTIGSWKSFISFFKPHTQIVVFDMPGVGGSTITQGSMDVSLNEQAEVLSAVVDHVVRGKVNLFAASWGGAAASVYASTNGDRVSKLILASFGLTANKNMKNVIDVIRASIVTENYGDIYKTIIKTFGEHLSAVMKKNIEAQFKSPDMHNIQYLYQHLLYCKRANLLQEIDFPKIESDTYIFSGDQDYLVDVDTLSILEKLLPHCKRRAVLECGHFMHFENPELLSQYAEILLDNNRTANL